MTAVDPRDVTLRDGLQDERVVSTDDKVGSSRRSSTPASPTSS